LNRPLGRRKDGGPLRTRQKNLPEVADPTFGGWGAEKTRRRAGKKKERKAHFMGVVGFNNIFSWDREE